MDKDEPVSTISLEYHELTPPWVYFHYSNKKTFSHFPNPCEKINRQVFDFPTSNIKLCLQNYPYPYRKYWVVKFYYKDKQITMQTWKGQKERNE